MAHEVEITSPSYQGKTILGANSSDETRVIRTDDNGNLIVVTDAIESTDLEGGGKVAVGTTAVEVTFTGTTQSITIASDYENVGTLFVGKSNVASDGSNALTFLLPGDSVEIEYNDSDNAVYVVSDTAAQNFWKGAIL